MKEINNLEDLKSLFDKPIFEWMMYEDMGERFVLAEMASDEYNGVSYIHPNGEIMWTIKEDFKPLPKPIEVTAEDCRRWASSEDAIGWQIRFKEEVWHMPAWSHLTFEQKEGDYQVRKALPTKELSNETIRPLTEVVADWMNQGMEG